MLLLRRREALQTSQTFSNRPIADVGTHKYANVATLPLFSAFQRPCFFIGQLIGKLCGRANEVFMGKATSRCFLVLAKHL